MSSREDAWGDKEFAEQWEKNAAQRNPFRAQQLDLVCELIRAYCPAGGLLLDLGVGTGQLEMNVKQTRPDIHMTGVDGSEAMLERGKKNLAHVGGPPVALHHADFRALDAMPEELLAPYDVMVSVQALHHVPWDVQCAVYQWASVHLKPGGLFILNDRVPLDGDMGDVHAALWDWMLAHGSISSAWTAQQYEARLAARGDFPVDVSTHLQGFAAVGLRAECLFMQLNRTVIVARKAS